MPEAVTDTLVPASKTAINELEQPRWAVISFDRCVGSALTYQEAAALIKVLDKQEVPGLCVVASEAAERLSA